MSGFSRESIDKGERQQGKNNLDARNWFSTTTRPMMDRSCAMRTTGSEFVFQSRLQHQLTKDSLDRDRMDDTESLFQLPVKKKIRFDDESEWPSVSPERKPFPNYESRVELLNANAEGAKLNNKLSAVTRELSELKATFELEREKLTREKQEIEYKFRQTEKDLQTITEREKELKSNTFSMRKEHEKEKRSLQERIRELTARNNHLEEKVADVLEDNTTRQKSLHMELIGHQKNFEELSNFIERLQCELTVHKSRSSKLAEKLKHTLETLSQAEKKCQEQSITLKEWRQENQIADSLRHDMADLKTLRHEVEILKQQNQKYKNLNENTALLKQQRDLSEEEVRRLKKMIEKFVLENNEIKIALSRHSSPHGSPLRPLNEIDALSAHCAALKQELTEKDVTLSRIQESVDEKERLIEELQQRIQQRQFSTPNVENHDAFIQTDSFRNVEAVSGGANFEAIIREKDELINLYMIKLGLILDYDPETTAVVHIDQNPLDIAHDEYKNELKDLQEVNSILKLRVDELEKFRSSLQQDNTNSTTPATMSATGQDVTMNVQKQLDEKKNEQLVESLRNEVQKAVDQRDRVVQTYKELSSKFRETCAYLTGYQIKLKDNDFYGVQSIYERSPERSFSLKKGPDGEFQLLANDYGSEWTDFIEMYLQNDNCFPAFLSAVTLQLFTKEKSSANDNSSIVA